MTEWIATDTCADCGAVPATAGRLCAACGWEYPREIDATREAVILAARMVCRTRTPESYNAAVERLAKTLARYDAARLAQYGGAREGRA